MTTLWCIPFSHYCEYARWSLEFARIPFREACVLPLLHMPVIYVAKRLAGFSGARARNASPLSTPLLLLAGGNGISDSSRIAAWANAVVTKDDAVATALVSGAATPKRPIGESEAVTDVVRQTHDVLGVSVRRYIYSHVLFSPSAFLGVGVRNAHGISGYCAAFFWVLLSPLLAFGIRSLLRVDPARRSSDAARLRGVFQAASAVLAEQPYLGGDAPSDADFAFAGIGSLAVLITPAEGFGCAWTPPEVDFPADMRSLFAELRATRAGQHIVKMYKLHRRASHIKHVN